MKKFNVYFEIFGKKLKTEVEASSQEDAKKKIKNKIIFHKVEKTFDDNKNEVKDSSDFMTDFFNMINKKKP
jgi:hypothetical protein